MNEVIITGILSIGCTFGGYWLKRRNEDLVQGGKKASAIIFKNNMKNGYRGTTYYPVVRFLTERQEWITQELPVSTGKIAEGTKVEVIYDPSDPTKVEINSKFRMVVLPWIFIGVGIVMAVITLIIAIAM